MASVKKRRWTHRGETKEAWVLRYTDNDRERRMETFKSKKAADERRKVIEQEIDMGTCSRRTMPRGWPSMMRADSSNRSLRWPAPGDKAATRRGK